MHFYRTPALPEAKKNDLLTAVKQKISADIQEIETEFCFNVEAEAPLTQEEAGTLQWLLSETFEPENFSGQSFLSQNTDKGSLGIILEVGPRMNFTTAWSANAVSVCHACALKKIVRIERSRRYKFVFNEDTALSGEQSEHSLLFTPHSFMTV
jgi:phosphoribosylformylglycinamidine synthase